MRLLGRSMLLLLAAPLLLAGAVALGLAYAPEQPLLGPGLGLVRSAAEAVAAAAGDDWRELPARVEAQLRAPLCRFGLPVLGLVLFVYALLPGGTREPKPAPEADLRTARISPRSAKKARKDAAVQARRGNPAAAAEICFDHGELDKAARYYVEAGDCERAAEIHLSQKQFREAAELYGKAGRHGAAGTILAEHGEFRGAAEAYVQAGNQSVAAEMFEKAGEFARAADCYAESGFPRQAAQAYVKCKQWEKAARCLEDLILEQSSSATRREGDLAKLARMAGDLYLRAGRGDRAQVVLEKGGCHAEAAERALANGQAERAAELFLKARDPQRAAAVLRSLGRLEAAARTLAEYHRDRGEDVEAARHFEEAGDFVAAGDLYRLLENFPRAGECYERQGEHAQAAEMFQLAGDRERAAANFERAGSFTEAAECHALGGDDRREAELLTRAGAHLRAGQIHREKGRDDDAIAVLQLVEPSSPEFAPASALLGQIFRERGMYNLAVKKLRQALGASELARDNASAFYTLANVYEECGQARDAVELYEKILAFDYHYEDVSQRLAKARELAESQDAEARSAAEAARLSATGSASGSAAPSRYKVIGKLGRGGMGIVYKAEDSVLERVVAFKVLPETLKENPQALKNFLREAKSAARLNHPNIVTVYDAGEQDGYYYIAMEYVDGNTLKEIIKQKGRLSAPGVAHLAAQICDGLAFAHDKQVVHRDIKTANIMWTRDRKTKIMDFGLAKVVEEVRNHTTVVSGTPYYMSPEQTLGKNVDHRTDLYSLGVSMFEMATATLPFRDGNLPYHHVHTPPPDPREQSPELPEVLARVILRCLEKNPEARYASAREVAEELRAGMSRS